MPLPRPAIPLTLSVLLSIFPGCTITSSESIKKNVRITTSPQGALVWVRDESGKQTLGRGPVTLSRTTSIDTSKPNWWVPLGFTVGAAGLLIPAFVLPEQIDEGTCKPEWGSDKVALAISGAGVAMGALLTWLLTALTTSEETHVNTTSLVIGAKLTGHQDQETKLTISPSIKEEFHFTLPPLKEHLARLAREKKRQIVVAVFDVQDVAAALDQKTMEQLTTYLETKLTQVAGYRIVPREQLRKQLTGEKVKGHKTCFDQSCQIELGKAVAAMKSLTTKLLKVGETCAITAQFFDLKTETAEQATSVKTDCSSSSLMNAIDKLVTQLTAPAAAAQ